MEPLFNIEYVGKCQHCLRKDKLKVIAAEQDNAYLCDNCIKKVSEKRVIKPENVDAIEHPRPVAAALVSTNPVTGLAGLLRGPGGELSAQVIDKLIAYFADKQMSYLACPPGAKKSSAQPKVLVICSHCKSKSTYSFMTAVDKTGTSRPCDVCRREQVLVFL